MPKWDQISYKICNIWRCWQICC